MAAATKHLVIVESGTKAKSIEKYLAGSPLGVFTVMASAGHVRQLPATPPPPDGTSKHGINLRTWAPTFETEKSKEDTVKKLRKAAKAADKVWLAADPDREGEAIAWHLRDVLRLPAATARVKFHEVTKGALANAFAAPGVVDMKLVNAQMMRQMLDRLFGYEVSPLLGGPNLSAGRVQSAALRILVERADQLLGTDWGARKLALTGGFGPGGGMSGASVSRTIDSSGNDTARRLSCSARPKVTAPPKPSFKPKAMRACAC